MAEVATKTKIDLSNIKNLVTDNQLAELRKSRNCLVHAMEPLDIACVTWELIQELPMMKMCQMFSPEEIYKIGWMHLQKKGDGVLMPLRDSRQKMPLCPVYLPMKSRPPGKRNGLSGEGECMKPLRTEKKMTDNGMLEQSILVDRDSRFYVLEAYWETDEEMSSRQPQYHGYRQLNGLLLRRLMSAAELHEALGGREMVSFFHHSMLFLQKVLEASVRPARFDYEQSVGVAGDGDQLKYEKYLTMVRGMNLFHQVKRQVHHRYSR